MRVWFVLVWTLIFAAAINGFAQRTAADFIKQAQVREQHKDYGGAIASCNQAIQLNPKDPKAYFYRGGTKFDRGDYEGAITDCDKAIELDPKYAEAYAARSAAKGKKEDYEGALADSNEAIKLDPRNDTAYSNRAAIEAIKGHYNAALTDANRAISISPRFASPYSNRGLAKANMGNFDGAIADLSEAIRLAPKDDSFYRFRGYTYDRQRNYQAARADYSNAIRINPKEADGYKRLGANRELQQDWVGALNAYYRSDELSLRKETKDFVHLRIWVIRTRTGQSATANQELSSFLGQHSRTLSAKAGAFLLGKLSQSEFLKAASSADPEKNREQRCLIWYYLGIKHLFAKETNLAKEYFTKCSTMGPVNADESLYAEAELRSLDRSGVKAKTSF